jgi:hypothetical protein
MKKLIKLALCVFIGLFAAEIIYQLMSNALNWHVVIEVGRIQLISLTMMVIILSFNLPITK